MYQIILEGREDVYINVKFKSIMTVLKADAL